MKFAPKMLKLVVVLLCVWAASGQLPAATSCIESECLLPDCRCSGTTIPGGLEAKNTPQFVLVTFDDAVTAQFMNYFRESLYARRNPHGCPVAATFFVSHEYTDYSAVNELYTYGNEIALHSISHVVGTDYWAQASIETLKAEFEDQRTLMSHFANIPRDHMQGLRIPYLQMAGNNSFEMMRQYGIQYDLSWSTQQEGFWPYTTDFLSSQECPIPPCPTAAIPGTWVIPMINWRDTSGNTCAMVDACINMPTNEDDLFLVLVENFERHYLGNRAPFGFYVHAAWFLREQPAWNAYLRFLDYLQQIEDVYVVNAAKVLEWVKDPVPVSELRSSTWGQCASPQSAFCLQRTCPVVGQHNQITYWMSSCVTCPSVYPWLHDPLGQGLTKENL